MAFQKKYYDITEMTSSCNGFVGNLGIDAECKNELCLSEKEKEDLSIRITTAANDAYSEAKVYTQFAEKKLKSITKKCTMQLGGLMGEKIHQSYLREITNNITYNDSQVQAIGEIVKLINNTSTIPFHRFVDLINGIIPGINKILTSKNIENLNEISYNVCATDIFNNPKDMFKNPKDIIWQVWLIIAFMIFFFLLALVFGVKLFIANR